MSRSKLGVNLPPIADYYSGSRYYIDLVKTSTAAGSFDHIEAGDPGPLDAAGWPTGNHGRHLSPFGKGLKGTMKIIAKGRLDAVSVRASPARATNIRYDATSNTSTADLVINSESVGVSLQIKGRGLGQFQVLRPGYTSAEQVFTTELLDLVRRFGFARYMDALGTNTTANDIAKWDDRALVTDQTYMRRGMPWEHVIDLANATSTVPWLNLPYPADDDCARRFAALVKAKLNPDLIPIFECDNESWGTHFRQGQTNAAAAAEEVKADPALRANPWGDANGSAQTWGWARQAKRAAWFNAILLETFASRDKYRLLLNAQADSPQCFDVQLCYFKAAKLKAAEIVHAVAIAPYADLDAKICNDPTFTPDMAFADGGIHVETSANAATKQYHKLAADNGVRCWVYEGGINCQDKPWGKKIPGVRTIQSDPRMGDAIERYLDNWDFAGGAFPDDRLFGYYTLQSPWLEEGPAANFGATEDVADVSGPKVRALIAAAERHVITAAAPSVTRVVVYFSDGTQTSVPA